MDIETLSNNYKCILQDYMNNVEAADDVDDMPRRCIKLPTLDDELFIMAKTHFKRLLDPSDPRSGYSWSCLNVYSYAVNTDGIEVSSSDGMRAINAIHKRFFKNEFVEYAIMATRAFNKLVQESLEGVPIGDKIEYKFYLDYHSFYGSDFNLSNMGVLQDGSQLLFAKGSPRDEADQCIIIGNGVYTWEYAQSANNELMHSKSIFV